VKLKTESGLASLKKIDILKGTAWYCYEKSFDWIPVDIDRVNEIIDENKNGKTPMTLSDTAKGAEIAFKTLEFKDDLLGDTDLTRLDHKNKKPKGKGGNRGGKSSPNHNNRSRNNKPNNKGPKSNVNDNKDSPKKPQGGNNANKSPRGEQKKKPNYNPNRRNKNSGPKSEDKPKPDSKE
jgi:hypothetical protein